MKKAFLLAILLAAVVLLAGCASNQETQFPETSTAIQRDPMSAANPVSAPADESEEDGSDFDLATYLFDKHLDFFVDYMENNKTAMDKLKARQAERKAAKVRIRQSFWSW